MSTSPASSLRVLPAASTLAMMIALAAACGGPDFTAGATPDGEVARAEAGDDVDNTPIILPPDNTGTTGEGDDGGDGPIEAGEGDATREGGGGDATMEGGGGDASDTSDASGSGDATIEGRGADATAETSGASGDAAALHDGGDAFVADSREETPAIPIDAAARAADAGCDPTHAPKDDACVVADTYGVFVSTSGLDTAAGSMSDPLKTITEGIAKATQLGKSRVYVCRGSYAEQVVLDAAHDGMGLYGGLDCASGWTWTGDKAQVLGPSALFALRVDATTKAVVIEDMGFSVPDASGQDTAGNGNSSVAAFVSNAAGDGVSFVRVALRAGAGADGSAGGVPATNWYSADAGDLAGNGGAAGKAGGAKDCPCTSWGDTVGGAGGALGANGSPGSAMPPAVPDAMDQLDGDGGVGSVPSMMSNCSAGDPGANGAPASSSALGAQSNGRVDTSGWTPSAGTAGPASNPGQGGGGGGGGYIDVLGRNVSGGGGCGGCGGAGGLQGAGGGGSIGMLVNSAAVTVLDSQLIASSAGNAGSGGAGEVGALGGIGGHSYNGAASARWDWGCFGGSGGNGAGGAGGGGGAGGISVGIVLNAAATVTVDGASTYTLGAPGNGGGGGAGGTGGGAGSAASPAAAGPAGSKGIDGVAQAQLSR